MTAAERRQRRNLGYRPFVDLAQRDCAIDFELRPKIVRREARPGVVPQSFTKRRDIFSRKCQSGGMAVAAELCEQLGHRFQGTQQMKTRNAAPGPLRHALLGILAQYENRAVEALDEAAGHDAEHASMPVGSAEDQRRL